ncbi:transposase [Parafrankia soli]|uniref:transposase n=1 Tax=Parafrankia soli TaxID=2599596 RepID=UPI0009F300EA
MTIEAGPCLFIPWLFEIKIPGRSAGARSEPPYIKEFRRQMVDFVRAGRTPEELAKEYGLSGQSLRNWVREAERPTPRPFRDDPNRVLTVSTSVHTRTVLPGAT